MVSALSSCSPCLFRDIRGHAYYFLSLYPNVQPSLSSLRQVSIAPGQAWALHQFPHLQSRDNIRTELKCCEDCSKNWASEKGYLCCDSAPSPSHFPLPSFLWLVDFHAFATSFFLLQGERAWSLRSSQISHTVYGPPAIDHQLSRTCLQGFQWRSVMWYFPWAHSLCFAQVCWLLTMSPPEHSFHGGSSCFLGAFPGSSS